MNSPRHRAPVSRRRMVAGLGLAGAAAVLTPTAADAAPTGGRHKGPAPLGKVRDATPAGLTPIASAPLTGYTYTFLDMWDFTPENFASGRSWTSAGGVYAPLGGGDTMWATTQLPPGAILGDVEWYVAATAETELMGRIWVSGTPTLMKQICDGVIPGSSTFGLVRAHRVTPSAATNGPYPHGTKIALGVFTPGDASVAVNGVRVGYKLGATATAMLSTPVRIYDSRTGTKILATHTRTHSLATRLPIGATAAIINVTVVKTVHWGNLNVYSSAIGEPGTSALSWWGANQALANQIQVGVSDGRSLKVTAHGASDAATHYILDLVGYQI